MDEKARTDDSDIFPGGRKLTGEEVNAILKDVQFFFFLGARKLTDEEVNAILEKTGEGGDHA
jgi:hypothetical protein